MKPSDFGKVESMSSVKGKSEHETIARTIMIILGYTGDIWRKMSWEEYAKERKKAGNYSSFEKQYFDEVIDFCASEQTARLFNEFWKEI